ncbi:Chitinase 2 [Gnomoniopsis sp. IMI 355080]|nr:Chitinase 2 [Gnomoniopsis sp. IMI 355080]
MFSRADFLVASLAIVPALATGSSVNVYFGQNGQADIGDVCADPSFEYITLGFIDVSPENGGLSGLPGSNFAGHCWAGDYDNNGYASGLLNDCPYLTPGIEVCQSQYGKKVLLSIGGVFTETSNYSISSYENGVEFANFIWGAFGPYDESWGEQPRPFDYNGVHVAVDGYDFDIESDDAGDEGYLGMIKTLRSLIEASGRDDIITGAPQCPLGDEYQHMQYLLKNVQFDRLWIQFYNNPQCEILNLDGTINSGFNYMDWEAFLATTPSANAKLHVGLPGSAIASNTGYVDAAIAASMLCSSQSSGSMFGGLMLWDQTFAAANVDAAGISYNEALYESMRCNCGECPVPTTTSSIVYSTSIETSTPVSSPFETSTSATSTCRHFTDDQRHGIQRSSVNKAVLMEQHYLDVSRKPYLHHRCDVQQLAYIFIG